jgi:hypothetical protein
MTPTEKQAERDYRIQERLGIDESPVTPESKQRAEHQVAREMARMAKDVDNLLIKSQ